MEAIQNPYQTPQGELTVDGQAHGEIKFLSPASRIGRLRYLAHSFLFMLVASIAMSVVVGIFAAVLAGVGLGETAAVGVVILLSVGCYIAMLVVYVIFMIQRLHDLNKSGWMSLLVLIPIVNFFFGLYLIFAPGTRGPNNYGLAPPPNRTWHWIVGLIAPALMTVVVVGMMAAIAIPAYSDYVDRAERAAQESQYPADAYQYEYEDDASYQYEDEASDDSEY